MASLSKLAEDDEDEDEETEECENAILLRNGTAFKQMLEKLDVQEIAKPLCETQTVILHPLNS